MSPHLVAAPDQADEPGHAAVPEADTPHRGHGVGVAPHQPTLRHARLRPPARPHCAAHQGVLRHLAMMRVVTPNESEGELTSCSSLDNNSNLFSSSLSYTLNPLSVSNATSSLTPPVKSTRASDRFPESRAS